MAEKSGFFNSSIDETREYADTDFAQMLSLLTGGQGYVAGIGGELKVTSISGMDIKVAPGAAWLGDPAGWWYQSDANISKTIEPEANGYDRIDRVVLRSDRNTDTLKVSIDIISGTNSASNPVAPSLTQGADIYEISLAQIYVTGGSASIEITDERDTEFCGKIYANAELVPVRKNYLINSNFDVWQRGESFAEDGYTADRWYMHLSDAESTIVIRNFARGQSDVPNNPTHYLRMSTTEGNDNAEIRQNIEGVSTLAGETVTLSFWAKGTNPGGGHFDAALRQVFGTGGTPSDDVPIFGDGFTVTSNWQRFEIAMEVPSTFDKAVGTNGDDHLRVRIWQPIDDGTNDAWTLDLASVKLEKGSTATEYVPKTVAEELMDCFRYYWQGKIVSSYGYGYGTGSLVNAGAVSFPVQMRVDPTGIIIDENEIEYENCENATLKLDKNGAVLRVTLTSTGRFVASKGIYSFDAEI